VKHKHRIKPGYEGGEYCEGNVVELTVTQHAMWHFAEWQRKGNWQDHIAWKTLVGQSADEEQWREYARAGGAAGGRGYKFSEETCAKLSKLRKGRKLSEEHKAKLRKPHKNKRKPYSEEHKKARSESMKRKWAEVTPEDKLEHMQKMWKNNPKMW
jgi:hypothetical protein